MKHGSLFSGIGGFDLAAEWMGWQNIFHCEWMPFPQKVLKHYWPNAISYHDITTTDFRQHHGKIDILTGGFPCQPYSAAGKRLGKDDERHLWPHMLRAIREISPRWVVGENVRGLTNWNGGVVFDEVQADLESAGYEVLPFLLPAVAVNAPHRRDRIWFVAYNNLQRCKRNEQQIGDGLHNTIREGNLCFCEKQRRHEVWGINEGNSQNGLIANANLHGLQQRDSNNEEHASQGGQYAQRDFEQSNGNGHAADAQSTRSEGERECKPWKVQFNGRNSRTIPTDWQEFPTQPPICGGDDGLPTEMDGITFSKWRAESIKGYGNAIVPQVALQIFKAIEQYEQLHVENR